MNLSPKIPLILCIALLATLTTTPVQAQQHVDVDATVEPNLVAPGQSFRYEITASVEGNYDISITRAPDFGPFTVVGRSSSPSFIVRNQQAQRSLRVYYQLRAPDQPGTYTIEPPRVTVGSRTLTPNPRDVRVSENARQNQNQPRQQAQQPSTDNDVGFVEIILVPDRPPYVGEQISLRYDLYVNQQHRGLRSHPPSDPDLDDFWVEELTDRMSNRRSLSRRNGQTWQVNPLRSIAIFPLRPGTATIDNIDVTLVRTSLFGTRRSEELEVISENLEIEVQPLPDGAPSTFSDTNIGDWTLDAFTDARGGRVGGRIILNARIDGAGRVGRLATPHLADTDDFELLATEDEFEQYIRSGIVKGVRTFEFHLMPLREGTLELPPVTFSYFDPNKEEYITHISDPISIDIEPGQLPEPDPNSDAPVALRGEQDTEEPPRDELTELHDFRPLEDLANESPTRSLPWWAYGVPILGLLLLLIEIPLTSRVQHHRAPARKRRRLRREVKNLIDSDATPDDLLKAIRLILTEGLGATLGALTVDEVDAALITCSIPDELARKTSELVAALIAHRYAPGNSPQGLAPLTEQTPEIIEKLLSIQYARESRSRPSTSSTIALVLIASLFSIAAPTTSHATESTLAAAEEATEIEDWHSAANHWAILADRSTNPTPDYNAGTAAARAGDLGRARLHLERALHKGVDTRVVRDNLDQVISAVSRHDPSVATFPPQEVASTGIQHLAPWLIAFGLWLAFLTTLLRRITSHPQSRSLFLGLVAGSIALSLFAAACWIYVDEFSRNAELGVVVATDQILRVAPSHHAASHNDKNTALPPGAITRLRQHRDGWMEVEFPSGATGWLPDSSVGLIEDK